MAASRFQMGRRAHEVCRYCIVAVILPISAFVAAGFEHSVANMYFVPLAIFLAGEAAPEGLTWAAFLLKSLVPVTLGNLAGGAGMVGLVCHVIYGQEFSTAR